MTLEAIERRRRDLASAARRLRVAATSDPGRAEELADCLVELTASALLAWDVADAAAPAPEAVVLAARILASRGPSGPYASLPDAVRYASASALLAAVQASLGQAEAAGRTLDGLDAWRGQLGRLPLVENLPEQTVLWLLVARARALLATDVAAANAWADAAEIRLHATAEPPAYLALAVHLTAADCRWAAGRADSALAHSSLALDTHRTAVAALADSRRPAVAKAAAAPVPAVYEAYAARLDAAGATDAALAVRREELSVLAALGAGERLAAARAGLAAALVAGGRADEAAELGVEPATLAPTPLGARVEVVPLLPGVGFEPADAASAQARWRQAEQSAVFAGVAAAAEAERAEAALRERARVAAERREAAQAEAERAARRADAALREQEAAEREREAALAAERAEREQEAARAAAEERRRALAEEHRLAVDPDAARAAAVELDDARRAVRDAGADPAALAAAQDRLAALLRPLAVADPGYREELATALESLVGLLWRLGDPEGSRAAAREVKTLGG